MAGFFTCQFVSGKILPALDFGLCLCGAFAANLAAFI
jgi:hypothetical protein